MADEWYFETEGETRGPVDMEELKRLAGTGRIGPGAMVRRGRDEWIVAQRVHGLFDGIVVDAGPAQAPADRLDDPGPDEDYRLPPSRSGGQSALAAYGIATLVLASLLTLVGCVSGVGSAFCFAGFASLQQAPPPGPAPGNPNAPANGATAAGAGCGAAVQAAIAGAFLVVAIIFAVVMAVHMLLAGGQFTVGIGVLRRRPWARILALVLSGFTASYGLLVLYEIVSQMAQSGAPGAPGGSATVWLALGGIVGLLFVAHAVLSWVVMFHPACSRQFRASHNFQAPDAME
jgi:GYF domain 2